MRVGACLDEEEGLAVFSRGEVTEFRTVGELHEHGLFAIRKREGIRAGGQIDIRVIVMESQRHFAEQEFGVAVRIFGHIPVGRRHYGGPGDQRTLNVQRHVGRGPVAVGINYGEGEVLLSEDFFLRGKNEGSGVRVDGHRAVFQLENQLVPAPLAFHAVDQQHAFAVGVVIETQRAAHGMRPFGGRSLNLRHVVHYGNGDAGFACLRSIVHSDLDGFGDAVVARRLVRLCAVQRILVRNDSTTRRIGRHAGHGERPPLRRIGNIPGQRLAEGQGDGVIPLADGHGAFGGGDAQFASGHGPTLGWLAAVRKIGFVDGDIGRLDIRNRFDGHGNRGAGRVAVRVGDGEGKPLRAGEVVRRNKRKGVVGRVDGYHADISAQIEGQRVAVRLALHAVDSERTFTVGVVAEGQFASDVLARLHGQRVGVISEVGIYLGYVVLHIDVDLPGAHRGGVFSGLLHGLKPGLERVKRISAEQCRQRGLKPFKRIGLAFAVGAEKLFKPGRYALVIKPAQRRFEGLQRGQILFQRFELRQSLKISLQIGRAMPVKQFRLFALILADEHSHVFGQSVKLRLKRGELVRHLAQLPLEVVGIRQAVQLRVHALQRRLIRQRHLEIGNILERGLPFGKVILHRRKIRRQLGLGRQRAQLFAQAVNRLLQRGSPLVIVGKPGKVLPELLKLRLERLNSVKLSLNLQRIVLQSRNAGLQSAGSAECVQPGVKAVLKALDLGERLFKSRLLIGKPVQLILQLVTIAFRGCLVGFKRFSGIGSVLQGFDGVRQLPILADGVSQSLGVESRVQLIPHGVNENVQALDGIGRQRVDLLLKILSFGGHIVSIEIFNLIDPILQRFGIADLALQGGNIGIFPTRSFHGYPEGFSGFKLCAVPGLMPLRRVQRIGIGNSGYAVFVSRDARDF